MAEVIWADGSRGDVALEFLAQLGNGRAAEVHLVRDTRTGTLYAEKLFKAKPSLSQMARDGVYWACFQGPFPYETKENAVQAALFRRKVLRDLTQFWFGTPLVADACYTRWDQASGGYLLGTEYVEGHGPRPGQFDPHAFRNLLLNYPVRLCNMATRAEFEKGKGPPWEINEVTAKLDELKDRFHQAGFVGSQWQVDKTLSVPTSNLLRDENGQWILIDAESGLPAVVLFKYIWAAIKYGSLPLFDDTDFTNLHKYLADNRPELIAKLGETRVQRLHYYVDQLQYHTETWKSSEPAIFRHGHRLLTDSQLRSNIRHGFTECWYRRGRISAEKARRLESSSLRFSSYLIFDLLRGLFSGLGTVAHSLKGLIWQGMQGLAFSMRLLHSAFFCETRLREIAESSVNAKVDSWQKSGRLTDAEAAKLRQDMESPTVAEYIKGFIVHLGLQLLEPPFVGNVLIVLLAILLGFPQLLVFMFVSPALRTGYTLYRAVKNRGKGISYRSALLVGALPKVGVLAYCLQMSTVHPDLSRFLARWQAANVGSHIPLFGGNDSRLEHLSIRAADIAASLQYELANMVKGLKSLIVPAKRSRRSAAQEKTEVSA